ncbi:FHA domain containing protein [Acanthamoeba castellanii str. Neff]|uniref:FHA domain containing protein n=1 Tax=Acanthamoeba castellanii (strain ATCC 30010 / Neff) TaxID=1257118 RepID=L8HC78_ACACF|nr:FHA domain containing protein [Acanthamoeba castellanii str. Neff]ELR22842.1 FHA domain containing protein [Acanthamoeba castellanii str. Neff]
MSVSLLLGAMEENGTASGASDVTHASYTDRPEADGEGEAPVDDSPYYTVSKSSTSSSSSSSTSSQTKQQPRSSSRLSARRSRQAEAERSASSTADIATNGGSSGGDDDGAAATAGGAAVPLWRQLRAASDEARRKSPLGAKDREAKLAKQQRILQHIAWTRAEQDLPPVFAILRGPTLRPYRMEELSLTLGRVTPHHRDADLALDAHNAKISRVHARIVYDRGLSCYCIINLSKNGVRVRQGDAFVSYAEVGLPVPLPNPATIDIQGTLVYFQVFYISSTPTSHFAAAHDDADFTNKRKRGQGVTYSEMIQTALRALGGAATQPKISRYIQEHFKEDIAGRATWRNSVSGVLSANPLFIQEAIISEGGKKDRKSLWRLKGFPLAGRAAAAAYKDDFDDDDDDEEDEDESALVMDENDDDESDEDDEDEDDARPEKRSRPDEGEQ